MQSYLLKPFGPCHQLIGPQLKPAKSFLIAAMLLKREKLKVDELELALAFWMGWPQID